MAQHGVVDVCRLGHEAVVFGGQGGVDAAGLAGGHEQCPASRVAAFGRSAVSIVEGEASRRRHRPVKARAPARELEPVRVAEPSEDGGGGNGRETGGRGDDAGRVGFTQQQRGPFVEVVDLLGRLQRQPGLEGDVFGQVWVIKLLSTTTEGFGRGEQRDRRGVAPGAARVPVTENRVSRPAEPLHRMCGSA